MTTTTLDPPQPRETVKKKGSIPRGFNLSLETRCWGRCRENPPFPEERESMPRKRKTDKKKREKNEMGDVVMRERDTRQTKQ